MSSMLLQSRSRQEDPEQLRLKQKAKEVRLYDPFLCKALWWVCRQDLSVCYCLYSRCSSRSWLRSGREKPTKRRWQLSDRGKSGEWTPPLEVPVQRWGMVEPFASGHLCLFWIISHSQNRSIKVYYYTFFFTLQGSGSGPSHPGGSAGAGSRQFMRQRITRVNLRDLLSCLENERGTSHSYLLYKGFLK